MGSPKQDLRVSGSSNVQKVASAMVRYIDEGCKVVLIAIGAGAVNQAVKALIIGRGMAATAGRDLVFVPGFEKREIEGKERTAIRFAVLTR